jgi:hypothetical protein
MCKVGNIFLIMKCIYDNRMIKFKGPHVRAGRYTSYY